MPDVIKEDQILSNFIHPYFSFQKELINKLISRDAFTIKKSISYKDTKAAKKERPITGYGLGTLKEKKEK